MASPFKIPKRKQPESGSDCLGMQSPLSRLQDGAAAFKRNWEQPGGRAGNALGCRESVVKSLLGLSCSAGVSAGTTLTPRSANHRADHPSRAGTPTHRPGRRAPESPASGLLQRWRPKRASDRLLEQNGGPERSASPPQKKRSSSEFSDLVVSIRSSSVDSADSASDPPAEEDAGSSSSAAERDGPERASRRPDEAPPRRSKWSRSPGSASDRTSDEDFASPPRPGGRASAGALKRTPLSSSPLSSVLKTSITPTARRDVRPTCDMTSWLAASSNLRDTPTGRRASPTGKRASPTGKRASPRSHTSSLRLRTPRETPSEPIVLSSEEECDGDEGDGERKWSESGGRTEASSLQQDEPAAAMAAAAGGGPGASLPAHLELDFAALHVGLTHARANGTAMITESGVVVPLKGSWASGGEDASVTVVASELLGYGVWDGGVARGGALLADWEGPAPSLLFLWVTDAQANLLQRELAAIQPAAPPAPPCSFLLLLLKEQLSELQAALLASMLDMEEFRRGRSSSSSSSFFGLRSPLDWSDGLLLLHDAPPPLDQHLLSLLGRSAEPPRQRKSLRSRKPRHLHCSGLQDLPSRLIQYPAAPCKGRITVTKEDLACLDSGEFLNDVIIDFYLKFLLLEGVGGAVAERCHVFSSFFYKQLSRRRAAGEEDAAAVPDRHMRHQRVKTWTRHVDIFTKDFLFVPVNQEAHWYLVVICFPGLEENQYEEWQNPASAKSRLQPPLEARSPRAGSGFGSASPPSAGAAQRAGGKPDGALRSHQPPECTQQGWQQDTVLKRPCILVMDSLMSYHENVCRLLRDYLQVEWEVRRGTPRLFTCSTMRGSSCRVPRQDNSSDCGLYLLQYTESFLQNPVVHFDLPLRLEHWFPRQQVRRKREEIRSLVMKMHESQKNGGDAGGHA